MVLYRITYTSIIDGLRHIYMNIGFESFEEAQYEVDILKRSYNKKWAKYTGEDILNMYINGTKMGTAMIARDYKVESINVTPV